MMLLLVALGLVFAGGTLALLANRFPRVANLCGVSGAVLGAVVGLVSACRALDNSTPEVLESAWRWDVPYGSLAVEIDALSALFLLPVWGLSGLAAIYGSSYLFSHRHGRSLGVPWFAYNLLVASMAVVVVARNGVLFLFAWEIMSLACFVLVTLDDEDERVREAGRTFLIATHLGTAFLLALFVLLGRGAETLDFAAFQRPDSPATANLLFLLALVGFGTKAGLIPFHVWLPQAHPAAPSHVSALMSGVMIKTGIYGLMRTLTFLPDRPAWWAWLLIGIGLVTAMWGILFALAQNDLKRLLAYSSIENIGIITLGLGIGVMGLSSAEPGGRTLAVLGLGGSLVHVLNHSLYKGALFLGAGSVVQSAGTREIDQLGGLLKRMPWTGAAFLVGAIAITGLPPLNGFVSEYLIYLAAFEEEMTQGAGVAVPALVVIAGLALSGGLAAACFSKAFGMVFLGHPRSESAAAAHRTSVVMYLPVLVLASCCLAVALLAPRIVPKLGPAIGVVTGLEAGAVSADLSQVMQPLRSIVWAAIGVLGLTAALAIVRKLLLARREVGETVTWDCGYAQPQPTMQYTASSFVQPLTEFFGVFLRIRRRVVEPMGLFPSDAALATEATDPFKDSFYAPLFSLIGSWLAKLRWLQHGRVHLYVLYIAATIVVLLVWNLSVSK